MDALLHAEQHCAKISYRLPCCVVTKVDGSRGEGVGEGSGEAGRYEDGIEVRKRKE